MNWTKFPWDNKKEVNVIISNFSKGENKMSDSKECVVINGVEYVKASEKASSKEGLQYVIIRTYSAGVHAGYLKRRDGREVELLNARRFYQWYGSATLSQFAQEGTSSPAKCKFPIAVDNIILTEAIEIIQVTEKAKKTIDAVPAWSA